MLVLRCFKWDEVREGVERGRGPVSLANENTGAKEFGGVGRGGGGHRELGSKDGMGVSLSVVVYLKSESNLTGYWTFVRRILNCVKR